MYPKYAFIMSAAAAVACACQVHADGHSEMCEALVGPLSENSAIDRAKLMSASDLTLSEI